MSDTNLRRRARPTSEAAAPSSGGGSWMSKGSQGLEKSKQIAAQRERRLQYAPPRFWVAANEEADIIILDASMSEVPFAHEHQVKDENGKFSIHELCPQEFDSCPLCERAKNEDPSVTKASYVMFLTILDCRPYTFTDKEGNKVERTYTKKIMAVKQQQHVVFDRISKQVGGNFRGLHLIMARDGGKQSASIGVPSIADISKPHLTEQEILDEFGHEAVMSTKEQGKVVKPANADCYPFDYEKMFSKPSGDDLRSRYGGKAVAGSRSEAAKSFDTDEAAATSKTSAKNAAGFDEDEIPF